MAVDTREFTTAWTNRTINQSRGNSVFLNFGNRRSEQELQQHDKYMIRSNEFTIEEETRSRAPLTSPAGGGALADMTAVTADGGGVDWFGIKLTGSRLFKTREDQRNIRRMSGVDLGSLRQAMVLKMTAWTDRAMIAQLLLGTIGVDNRDQVLTAVPPTTTALPATSSNNVGIDISTHQLKGGNDAAREAWGNAFIAWLDQVVLDLGAEDWTGPQATGDTLRPVVVMPAAMLYALEQRVEDKYKSISERIAVAGYTAPVSVGFAGKWKGRWRGEIDIYVSNRKQLTARDGTTAGSADGLVPIAGWDNTDAASRRASVNSVYRALMFVPSNTYDSALLTYPARMSPPDGTSAKWRLQQEIEVGFGVVNGDQRGIYRQLTALGLA